MSLKFIKKKEDFTCLHCNKRNIGNGYTNHCIDCLRSLHIDNYPGDRSNTCLGIMDPISFLYKNGAYSVLHKCRKCNLEKRNKLQEGDNLEAFLTNI